MRFVQDTVHDVKALPKGSLPHSASMDVYVSSDTTFLKLFLSKQVKEKIKILIGRFRMSNCAIKNKLINNYE